MTPVSPKLLNSQIFSEDALCSLSQFYQSSFERKAPEMEPLELKWPPSIPPLACFPYGINRQENGEDWEEADTVSLKIHNRTMLTPVQHHFVVSLWLDLRLGFFYALWDTKKQILSLWIQKQWSNWWGKSGSTHSDPSSHSGDVAELGRYDSVN